MKGSTVPTKYWQVLDDGRVLCPLCPRACKLHDRQRGVCFVRERQDDQIVLTSYGRSSGFCGDPIEKNPLNHFLPGSSVLSFGTARCNLACRFCQNWDISKSKAQETLNDQASPDDIAAAAWLGCASVAFTYNDPVIFHEYAIDVADACRSRGIKAVAVTAGYVNAEPRGVWRLDYTADGSRRIPCRCRLSGSEGGGRPWPDGRRRPPLHVARRRPRQRPERIR